MIWVGLDLHKRYITACAIDDAGAVVAEHRRLPTDPEVLLAWLGELGGPASVAMEATLYWAWLHDRLSEAGIAALAAHPYQVKLIWQARCKTDPLDARKLADLARTNLLPAIWVATPAVRAQRTLLRGRAYLVRMQTGVKNRIHGLLTAENHRLEVQLPTALAPDPTPSTTTIARRMHEALHTGRPAPGAGRRDAALPDAARRPR